VTPPETSYTRWASDDGRIGTPHQLQSETQVKMATASLPHERIATRLALVQHHISLENAHDLEGVLATFGNTAHYDDEAWGEHHEGPAGVRAFYQQLMSALPDLEIRIQRQHIADEAILVEVVIRGTHLGSWRGLPPTGRRIEFPLCGVYTFDEEDRLAGERIYYDRGTVLRQLGVFHEPQSTPGMISVLLTHPLTIARALIWNLFRR
jgi:steroid delta-isomerase-like uncharacterized protein